MIDETTTAATGGASSYAVHRTRHSWPKNASRSGLKPGMHRYDKMSRHAMAVHEVKPQVRHLLPQGNRAHGTDPTQHDQCNHTRNELAVVNKLHGRYSRPRPQRVKRTYCSSLSHPCLPEAISSCTGSLLNLTRTHQANTLWLTKHPRPLLPNGQR